MKVLVLAPTCREGCGIAEYTRQIYDARTPDVDVEIRKLSAWSLLSTPLNSADVVHVQHEYFLFDCLVGITALFWYVWLRLWCSIQGRALITTFHTTYDTSELGNLFPQFKRIPLVHLLGGIYLNFHMWVVGRLSDEVIVLSPMGVRVLRRCHVRATYIPVGNHNRTVVMKRPEKACLNPPFFTLFGFAFPNKGYDVALRALKALCEQPAFQHTRLVIVSGNTPGRGLFKRKLDYLSELRALARRLEISCQVVFTGYLNKDDPLLCEIFSKTTAFIFPYRNRSMPSGAIATAVATGRPILVSDIEAFREHIDSDFPNFHEGDPTNLMQRMMEILTSSENSKNASLATVAFRARWPMQRVFQEHLKVFNSRPIRPFYVCKPVQKPGTT